MLVTSNRLVTEWGGVFGGAVVATAIQDGLLHNSRVITIRGDSCRLRTKREHRNSNRLISNRGSTLNVAQRAVAVVAWHAQRGTSVQHPRHATEAKNDGSNP